MSDAENMLPDEQPPTPTQTTKGPKMPPIDPNLIKDTPVGAETPAPAPQKKPFYQQSWFIVLFVLFFWPIGLALVWSKGCGWKKSIKIAATVACLSLACLHIYSIYRALDDAKRQVVEDSYLSYSEPLESETAQESVETTTELLSSDEKSSYEATALLTSPNQNELLSVFSDFEPQIIEGKGDQTIDLSAYTEPVLVTVDYDGEDLISVWTNDGLEKSSVLLVNSIGSFHGTTTTMLADDAPQKLTVEEMGDSAWTITISPINRMPNAEASKTYYQSQVLLVAPENQTRMNAFSFNMTSEDETNSFEAYALGKTNGQELALSTGKNYSGEAEWSELPCVLVILTDGEWSFDIV